MTASATGGAARRATRVPAGRLRDGTPVEAVTLANACGMSARILTYGATLQALVVTDSDGTPADIVLGHDDVAGYEATRGFLGVTIGRYANRIADGRFVLDGETYDLSRNDDGNTLHGGAGFDQAVWTIVAVDDGHPASVVFGYASADGADGFPGTLDARVAYTLDDDGDLTITFTATTTRPTIVNMTNHALFDLSGGDTPEGATAHWLTIAATAYTPVDDALIPTGALRNVAGTPFDFRQPRIVAEGLRDGRDDQIAIGHGYDHNFALDKGPTAEPQFAARLEHAASGRRLDVLTTEPGLQLYTANAFDGGMGGKRNRLYRMGDGIALEPQKFPDTPNRPAFGSARLDPGETYRHTMIYRPSIA